MFLAHRWCCRCSRNRNYLGRSNFGQSEVQDLGVTALAHEDIGRLDVTVYDPLCVCRVQPICNLRA